MSQLLDLLAFSMTLRFRLATRPDSPFLAPNSKNRLKCEKTRMNAYFKKKLEATVSG